MRHPATLLRFGITTLCLAACGPPPRTAAERAKDWAAIAEADRTKAQEAEKARADAAAKSPVADRRARFPGGSALGSLASAAATPAVQPPPTPEPPAQPRCTVPPWAAVVASDDGNAVAVRRAELEGAVLKPGWHMATAAEIGRFCDTRKLDAMYVPKADFPSSVAGLAWSMTPADVVRACGGMQVPAEPGMLTLACTRELPVDIGIPGVYVATFQRGSLAEIMIMSTLPPGTIAAQLTDKYGPPMFTSEWRAPTCAEAKRRDSWGFRKPEGLARILVTESCTDGGQAMVFYQNEVGLKDRTEEMWQRDSNY